MRKAKAQVKHARRRFLERFGLRISDNGLREMVLQIQSARAEFVRKESNRVSLWKVRYCGELFDVVYDKQRKNIVTVLPVKQAGTFVQ